MLSILKLLAGFAVVSLVCSAGATGASAQGTFPTETSVVLTGAAGLELIARCSAFEFPTPQWDPTPADIASAEAALLPALRSALKTMNDDASPTDYFRQYAGGFYEGDHIIYVRGFHRSYLAELRARDDWRIRPVPTGRGHTRFWCAHWVKETKNLVPTVSMGDPAMGVGFFGRPASNASSSR